MDVNFINFLTCGCIKCALCVSANADPYAIFGFLIIGWLMYQQYFCCISKLYLFLYDQHHFGSEYTKICKFKIQFFYHLLSK